VEKNQQLKIAIIVSDLSSSGAGRWGGGVRPFLLYQALKKLDHQVKIYGFNFGEKSEISPAEEIQIITVQGANYPQFLLSAQNIFQQIDADIIYAYKPKPSSFGLSLLYKFIKNKPLILDIDDWELSWKGGDKWQYQGDLRQFVRDILKPNGAFRTPDHIIYLQKMEKLVKYADLVTLHTQFLQDRFGGIYLPNGKDTDLFNPNLYNCEQSKQIYGLSDYKVLMFPGAPRPYKGIEDVLIALDQLQQSDLKLVIVGGSPYDDYDQQLMAKWGQWIIQLPKFPVQKMPEIVAAADIIIVPQRDTPAAQAQFPLKLTDGMAMAKPILATSVGDIPTILGDTGYLVDAENPAQIAEKINWIFANFHQAKQQGIKARDRCIKYYSIETMAGILTDVLEKIKPT
jgi:glycosyltransferase involved in cell wall biosynthesis